MDKYQVIQSIGKGSFGTVHKIRRKSDGKTLVWKQLNYGKMADREKQLLVQEVNILQKLRHPHIVRYYDRIVDRDNTTLFIVMEYCESGDLSMLIRKCRREKRYVDEDVIWKIFTQLVLALGECHKHSDGVILHRDVKPGNIFLEGTSHNVKLGDFGLARILGKDSLFAHTYVGTPYYMSPEQTQGAAYNEKCDIWSLGCLIYELAALVPPFEALSQSQLERKIRLGRFSRIPSHYSDDLDKSIKMMLQLNRRSRASIDELIKIPHISLRLRERKLHADIELVKQKEHELKQREALLKKREGELEKREALLNLKGNHTDHEKNDEPPLIKKNPFSYDPPNQNGPGNQINELFKKYNPEKNTEQKKYTKFEHRLPVHPLDYARNPRYLNK